MVWMGIGIVGLYISLHDIPLSLHLAIDTAEGHCRPPIVVPGRSTDSRLIATSLGMASASTFPRFTLGPPNRYLAKSGLLRRQVPGMGLSQHPLMSL